MGTKFNLNFDNITFKTNWATITAIVSLLVAATYLYVDNQSKDQKIIMLEARVSKIEKMDSVVHKLDNYVVELLKKSSELSEYDGMIFYKDVYFENKFRKIDGKQYFEFIPDKMDFYQKSMPGHKTTTLPGVNPPPTN